MAKHDPTLSRTFLALADPTRRKILERLAGGDDIPVGTLAAPFPMALPSFLKHISTLEAAGLITTRKSGRVRICTARMAPLRQADDWLQHQQNIWEARTDRMEAFALTLKETDHDTD